MREEGKAGEEGPQDREHLDRKAHVRLCEQGHMEMKSLGGAL